VITATLENHLTDIEHIDTPSYWHWIRWLAAVGAAVILLIAGIFVAPHLSLSLRKAYVIGFCIVVCETLVVSLLTPRISLRILLFALIPVSSLLAIHFAGDLGAVGAIGVTAALLVVGPMIGSVVGAAIEHPGHLIFVAVVSAIADVFSVYSPQGPTAVIVRTPEMLSVLSLPWPLLGSDEITGFLGVGDIVFTTLYFNASRKHRLGHFRTVTALVFAFAVTMVLVVCMEMPIPVLPFMGLAIVLFHPITRKPPEKDIRKGWIAVLVIAAIACLLSLIQHVSIG